MNKSESIMNITAAIIAVMNEVKSIDKAMTVGEGRNAYKGVSDESVKTAIGEAMAKNGLAIVPTDVQATERIDRWEDGGRMKQQVFNSVHTKYLLLHTSGEWIELAGHGHGTDSQDKAAGKATTYALKYTLLYTFMVATAKIDDTDATHSDSHAVPAKPQDDERPWLNENSPEFARAKAAFAAADAEGKQKLLKATMAKYKVSKKAQEQLLA